MILRRSLLIFATALSALALENQRLIPLEGARNVRDIGGYATNSGKTVRWGRVFRAGSLGKLTDADFAKLADLNIRTVCDYRSSDERASDPTLWRGSAPVPETVVLDLMAANPGRDSKQDPTKAFMARLAAPGMTPEKVSQMLSAMMSETAISGAPLYGKMMRRLIDLDAPLLYHCTAGKDRTGLSTALLMKVLDVKDEHIYADYLLVNELPGTKMPLEEIAKRYPGVDPELLGPALGTRREWLDAAFQGIDAKYGSFANYQKQALGLGDDDVKRLRARLLE